MNEHWFVVASQKTVKVYTEIPDRSRLKQIKVFDNPLGRERNQALFKKQAGMGIKSSGRVGMVRYSETKRHDPHEEAALQFAKEISEYLERQRLLKHFKSLTIVAEPNFLGKMRAEMAPGLKKLVTEWLKKDLQKTPQIQLSKFLLPLDKGAETGARSNNL